LGAELISSDAVAIYELVKNAIDARSEDGVTIEFCITLRHSDYIDALTRVDELAKRQDGDRSLATDFDELKKHVIGRILPDASIQSRQNLERALLSAGSVRQLRIALHEGYVRNNWIEFRDTGCGMSKEDLLRAYLVIGTPSRRRDLDAAVAAGSSEVPYLGEKGVGRLSAMRLGSFLQIKTAAAADEHLNLLEVDWSKFDDLDKLVGDIVIEPTKGDIKPARDYSGTSIRINNLNASWSPKRIAEVANHDLARIADPFSKAKRRFRISILFNETRIEIPRLDRAILELAHARAVGHYEIVNGKPRLEVEMWCGDLGNGNLPQERRIFLEHIDLQSLTRDGDTEISKSALCTVGPFSFELYWYNRRLLRGVDSIGERKRVMALQSQWSGIMMFRGGYRVSPYGNDTDDWLGLDRKALASPGYKLNKTQFIGRVSISRISNPQLIDQTNREGLKDCDEKSVLVEVLRYAIQERLRLFIDEVYTAQRKITLDFEDTEKRVNNLETRAKASIRELEKRHANEKPKLRELLALIEEMHAYFVSAKERAEQVEDERDRMIQLAGVGLMLEIIAHELARSTEFTLRMLGETDRTHIPTEVASLFGTLQDEMKAMNKRLRVLDPLSVSARQRKETFDMVELVREIFSGHKQQFLRHKIKTEIKIQGGRKEVHVRGVRGMFVQIIENLVQNSVYWMDLRMQDEEDYHPKIEVVIGELPHLMEYTDNGPGVQPSLREEVFKAFFSTKGKSRRQGLGLFIASDCAKHHDGQLYLSEEQRIHRGRLNTFILEIPKSDK
jgi:signal transduction histidine kinase